MGLALPPGFGLRDEPTDSSNPGEVNWETGAGGWGNGYIGDGQAANRKCTAHATEHGFKPDFHMVALLAFIWHCDKLYTPTFLRLCYFVFCCNFCAPQCACTAVLRSRGPVGDRHLVTVPQGGGEGPSDLGWGRTRGGGVWASTTARRPNSCTVCALRLRRPLWPFRQ